MSTPASPKDLRGAGETPPGTVPRALAVALGVLLAEAAVLGTAAAWFVVELVRGTTADLPLAVFLVVFAAGISAALVLAARALRGGRRGGRAPAVGWQLLQGATAVTVLQVEGVAPGPLWSARAALLAAVVVVVLLMTPRVVRFTTAE